MHSNVSDIANHVNLSLAYMQRLFKAETGSTISEYINRLRLQKAKHLLIHTEMSIIDIAENTGLVSRQRLTQLFSKYEGMSPGKYRQTHKNIEED